MEKMTPSKLARDTAWKCIANVKDFDARETSIIRVYQHASGFAYVFCQHGTGKNVDGKALVAVDDSIEDTLMVAAATAKVSKAVIAKALAALA